MFFSCRLARHSWLSARRQTTFLRYPPEWGIAIGYASIPDSRGKEICQAIKPRASPLIPSEAQMSLTLPPAGIFICRPSAFRIPRAKPAERVAEVELTQKNGFSKGECLT